MIEVSDEWLEQKRAEAKGSARYTPDALLDAIASGDLKDFNRLPPGWKLIIGFHNEAKRRRAALRERGVRK